MAATPRSDPAGATTRARYALIALLVPPLVAIWGLFPYRAFADAGIELQLLSTGLAVFTLMTLVGLWLGRPFALWAALVVAAFCAVLYLYAFSYGYLLGLATAGVVLLVPTVGLLFYLAEPLGPRVNGYQRTLYAFVLVFAAWVAIWGLLFPASISRALFYPMPPLHARFFGAVYLCGTVYVSIALFAGPWAEVRVVTLILAVWTTMLSIVSVLNLSAFDWSERPVWFWFVAYTGFPLVGWWIVWSQRGETGSGTGPEISAGLRAYLYAQGAVATVLAVALFFAPRFMTTQWPWPMYPVIAQLYSAPILGFGLGSLYAARQRHWSEVRMVVVCTLVLGLAVLAGSALHAGLFDGSPSTWIWFGGFGLIGVATLLFMLAPSLRATAAVPSPKG